MAQPLTLRERFDAAYVLLLVQGETEAVAWCKAWDRFFPDYSGSNQAFCADQAERWTREGYSGPP